MIKLPIAIRDNKTIMISDLTEDERGLKCRCYCPYCNKQLVAKLGKVREHHFAHNSHNNVCTYGTETGLHKLAKEILEAANYILLPPLKVVYKSKSTNPNDFHICYKNKTPYKNKTYDSSQVIIESDKLYYDSVKIENRLGNIHNGVIIPDIIIYKKNIPLIIEIAVSHKVDENKLKKIKNKNISAIEILLKQEDLFSLSKEELTNEIINNIKNKYWLYNRKAENKIFKIIGDNNSIIEKELEMQRKLDEEYRKQLIEDDRLAKIAIKEKKLVNVKEVDLDRKSGVICMECNQLITDGDWWCFDKATNLCKCNKCYNKRHNFT